MTTRRAFSWVYWLVAIGFGISVAISATVGAFSPQGVDGVQAVSEAVSPVSAEGIACVKAIGVLHEELVARAGRTFVGDGGPSPDFAVDWESFSADWRVRLQREAARCRVDERPAMKAVSDLVDDLLRLQLAYTTALLGFSDVGRAHLVKLREAFVKLRPPVSAH
ncbi:MAG: hypothetical protein EXR76_20340 [Myxococcales bacterium]|nr:hypothetical protein [Myxococcales bacterium]